MPLMVVRAAISYHRPGRKTRQGLGPRVQETAPEPAPHELTGLAEYQDCDIVATGAYRHPHHRRWSFQLRPDDRRHHLAEDAPMHEGRNRLANITTGKNPLLIAFQWCFGTRV
jgi:hypothetical protein